MMTHSFLLVDRGFYGVLLLLLQSQNDRNLFNFVCMSSHVCVCVWHPTPKHCYTAGVCLRCQVL